MAKRAYLHTPDLEPHCGSWICTSQSGNIREFYKRSTAEHAGEQGWKVQTAFQYLVELNKKIAEQKP